MLQPEIDKADAAVDGRVGAARGGAWPPAGWPTQVGDGPQPEDLAAGLERAARRGARRRAPRARRALRGRRPDGATRPARDRADGVGRSAARAAHRGRRGARLGHRAPRRGSHRRSGRRPPHPDAPVEPRAQPDARSGRCHCADRCRARPPPPTTPLRRMSTSPPPRPSTPTRKPRRPPAAGPVSAEHRRPAVFRTTHIRTKLAFALAVPLAGARRRRRLRGRQRRSARSTRPGRRRSSSRAPSDPGSLVVHLQNERNRAAINLIGLGAAAELAVKDNPEARGFTDPAAEAFAARDGQPRRPWCRRPSSRPGPRSRTSTASGPTSTPTTARWTAPTSSSPTPCSSATRRSSRRSSTAPRRSP